MILAVVPQAFHRQKPTFPADFIWHCPDSNCPHAIDFRYLRIEDLQGIRPNDREYLLSMEWNSSDEEFIELFYDIVEMHFLKHLSELGVKHVVSRREGNDVHGQPIYSPVETKRPAQSKTDDLDVSELAAYVK